MPETKNPDNPHDDAHHSQGTALPAAVRPLENAERATTAAAYGGLMMVLVSRTAVLSPPVRFVWKALMRPDVHPKNQGFAWPVMFEGAALPRIVESSEFDRVVWSSPWPTVPDVLLQFDLRPETRLRWTLLAHAPAPSQQTIDWLRDQVSHLVNIDLRNATGY